MAEKIIFWNVDTQIDFMKPTGKLYVPNAEEIEPALEKLTQFAKEHNIQVVNTSDYHNEDSLELSDNPDFISTFPPHCMKNSAGSEFVKETQPKNPLIFDWDKIYDIEQEREELQKRRNILIRKDKFDVFAGNPNAENILSVLNPAKVYIYGVTTNVCVDKAVIGLVQRGIEVVAIKDAIKELPNIPLPFDTWINVGVKFSTIQNLFAQNTKK